MLHLRISDRLSLKISDLEIERAQHLSAFESPVFLWRNQPSPLSSQAYGASSRGDESTSVWLRTPSRKLRGISTTSAPAYLIRRILWSLKHVTARCYEHARKAGDAERALHSAEEVVSMMLTSNARAD